MLIIHVQLFPQFESEIQVMFDSGTGLKLPDVHTLDIIDVILHPG